MQKIRKQIGILGGSFNPPSTGHIQLTQLCAKYLDEVWVMPCYNHVQKNNLISDEHRLNMLDLIKFSSPNIFVSSFEIDNKLPGRTYDVLSSLKEYHKEDLYDFHYILGSDCANNIQSFYNYEKLIEENSFFIVGRKGCGLNYGGELIKKFEERGDEEGYFILLNEDILEVSSTELRYFLEERDSKALEGKIDSNVLSYIVENNLYI